MTVKIKHSLPAQSVLKNENIYVFTEHYSLPQNIRPLNVLILNLMPDKIPTETQLLRVLSNSPLRTDVEFLQTASYTSARTQLSHLSTFYKTFDEVKNRYYDGMIVTGAPLTFLKYEEVAFWDELCRIIDWAETHVRSTLFMCWSAFAALYHLHGINNFYYDRKLSGVYPHYLLNKTSPLFRGFDDIFYSPQSREIGIRRADIDSNPELELLAFSDKAGVTIVKSRNSKTFFITCHPEYEADTLAKEYYRDLGKGLNPGLPENYFPNDNPENEPIVNWRSAGQLLYTNWLHYYVSQSRPCTLKNVACL